MARTQNSPSSFVQSFHSLAQWKRLYNCSTYFLVETYWKAVWTLWNVNNCYDCFRDFFLFVIAFIKTRFHHKFLHLQLNCGHSQIDCAKSTREKFYMLFVTYSSNLIVVAVVVIVVAALNLSATQSNYTQQSHIILYMYIYVYRVQTDL